VAAFFRPYFGNSFILRIFRNLSLEVTQYPKGAFSGCVLLTLRSTRTHARTHARTSSASHLNRSLSKRRRDPNPRASPYATSRLALSAGPCSSSICSREATRFREKLQAKTDHTAHAPAPARAHADHAPPNCKQSCTVYNPLSWNPRIPDFAFSNLQLRLQLAFRPSGRPWPALRITPRDSDLSHVISTSRMPPRRLLNIRY
jgi:hypothetical protein